ncbi:MAG: ferrous iron transport protein B [Christensenellales bacterium]
MKSLNQRGGKRKRYRGGRPEKDLVFALVGNQNSGKTTLFNQLTGSRQRVGNWPGVTVEKKEGQVRARGGITLIDLPGIYSLSPYTMEEVISRDYIIDERPDAVINVVDATNIERSLYLTLQLAELGTPMVVALNMMDEVRALGDSIDIRRLESELGVPVVPISASRNEGTGRLLARAVEVAQRRQIPPIHDICSGDVHKALHAIAHLAEDKARARGYPVRYTATKLVEGDALVRSAIGLDPSETALIEDIVHKMEKDAGQDREALLADTRYDFIGGVVGRAVKRKRAYGEPTRSDRIDAVLTNRFWAYPIFLLIMFLVFEIAFGFIGSTLRTGFTWVLDSGVSLIDGLLENAGASPWVTGLAVDGVLAGVSAILSFMPVILLLFLCLSVLEDSGYMARAAFMMDRLLRHLGLSGRSFIPMIMGFGCSVPAIMATRTLDNERDRRLTIFLTPFMSCGAKVPVYAVFTAAFFQRDQSLVMLSIYVLGAVIAVVSGLVLKKTVLRGEPAPFVLELPTYRLPTLKSVLLHMWEKARGFVKRAFTVILAASVLIWFLQSFDFSLSMVADSSTSILAYVGMVIAPVLIPLGFGTWQAATALVTGFTAKEVVISTMAVLYAAEAGMLSTVLQGVFTPLSAYAFMAFTALYLPCVAAFSAMVREMGSWKWALGAVGFQTLVAWTVAFIIFQGGRLLGLA